MSAWELPTTVEVAGQKFAIRSDFRAVLDALAALADPELTQQEQYMACLQILYPRWRDLPDLNDALQAAFIFINNGKDEESRSPLPRLVDWGKMLPSSHLPWIRYWGTAAAGATTYTGGSF